MCIYTYSVAYMCAYDRERAEIYCVITLVPEGRNERDEMRGEERRGKQRGVADEEDEHYHKAIHAHRHSHGLFRRDRLKEEGRYTRTSNRKLSIICRE